MIRRVTIVGDGVTGWLAAAAILRAFGPTRQVTVVPHDPAETGAIATDADFVRFLRLLGLAVPPGTTHWGHRCCAPDGTVAAFVPSGGAPGGAFACPGHDEKNLATAYAAATEAAWSADGRPGLATERAVLSAYLRDRALADGARVSDTVAPADGSDLTIDTTGAGAAGWSGQVVRIGGAGDTLADAAMAQKGVSQLLQLFPLHWPAPALVGEYNRRMASLAGWYADAAALRARIADGTQSPPSPRLVQRIALFAASGRLTHAEDDPLPGGAWMSLLLGCGIMPRSARRYGDAA